MADDLHPDTPTVTIRPRWTWAGVALLALGVGLLGAAAISLLWPLAIAGAVLVVLGAGAAYRGNLYRDARMHQSPRQVASEIDDNQAVEVVDPDARVVDPEVRAIAREAHETKRAALGAERGPLEVAPLGIGLLLAVALWLAITQGLVPFTEEGRDTRNLDIAVAIPLALAAFGLRNSFGRLPAYVVVLACGVALVALAIFSDHAAEWTMYSQLISGILVFVGAALAIGRNGIATLGR
ncbi:hypothetical protein KLP28_10980 [Nocardioidaceae bacterium]|nr:hypothetical protein KLP28_10980 [Nocardioidaceae bacterium]